MFKIKAKIIRSALPWIATLLTVFPCRNWNSRLLDRLIIISEGEAYGREE